MHSSSWFEPPYLSSLCFTCSAVTFKNRLVDLLYISFLSMENHLLVSCALPDWVILFTEMIDPCRADWTVTPQDLVLKVLTPLELTSFTNPAFEWGHAIQLFHVATFSFMWLQRNWWTTFMWLTALPHYGVASLAWLRRCSSHPLHYHDVRMWYPSSLELRQPSFRRLSTTPLIERHQFYSRSKKSYSPFGHVQCGPRLHVHYRYTYLQVSFNVQLPKGK
jgi:hypothetical protein